MMVRTDTIPDSNSNKIRVNGFHITILRAVPKDGFNSRMERSAQRCFAGATPHLWQSDVVLATTGTNQGVTQP